MTSDESTVLSALARIGVSVTPGARASQGWGWSIANAKLVQPWVGPYASPAAATGAALDWLMLNASRGVLFPIMQASAAERPADLELAASQPQAEPGDSAIVLSEELLAPWVRALQTIWAE